MCIRDRSYEEVCGDKHAYALATKLEYEEHDPIRGKALWQAHGRDTLVVLSLIHIFLSSNFWLYWRTMFAFENWHSALEMKLYIQRYICLLYTSRCV